MQKRISLQNLMILLVLSSLLLSFLAPMDVTASPPAQTRPEPVIEAEVSSQIATTGAASFWIEFEEQVDLTAAYSMDWEQRGWYVYDQLNAAAQRSQNQVRTMLDRQGADYRSFWINNSIYVENAGQTMLNNLTRFDDVAAIRAPREVFLHEPTRPPVIQDDNTIQAVESNLTRVKAPDVWALGYTGQGIVVANIDTGVRYTHQALINQYRGNLGGGNFSHDYNWRDPYGEYNAPFDSNGHGSHTMGTIVGYDGGSNQIGMAPGADWIACRACSTSSCGGTQILACAQFVTAPTKVNGSDPNPSLRAHVVNNSWGDCGTTYNSWFQSAVNAWHAAGIYPVFSNGNAGNCGYTSPPGLNTVSNPARYGNVTGVGSTGQSNGLYASHSNWGPTDNLDTLNPRSGFANLKPQVVAPGVNIRSSIPSSESAYQSFSGTSMSAPHVSGLVALMWQAGTCLIGDYAATETLIEDTATPIIYNDGSDQTPTNYPNFATGWGEINALAAVQAAGDHCGGSAPAIEADPQSFVQILKPAQTAQQILTLTNSGTVIGNIEVTEIYADNGGIDLIEDGSFELGTGENSPWQQYSLTFGSPLCSDYCGTGGGTVGPRTGDWWGWFGGAANAENGYVSQRLIIPPGYSDLSFYLRMGMCGNSNDYINVQVDGEEVWKMYASGSRCGEPEYALTVVDLFGFDDGNEHEIKFESLQSTSSTTNISLDDISLVNEQLEDISWLTLSHTDLVIPPSSSQQITFTFNAAGLNPGSYAATVRVQTTPYLFFNIPVNLIVVDGGIYLPLIRR
jgi:subtilisin family serine protease